MEERLSRSRIVAAATALAEEEGLARLTMRRLGAALGVEGMALYHHVRDKATLQQAMAESVFDDPPPAPSGDWRADFRALSHHTRALLTRHPEVFGLVVSRPLTGPGVLRHREAQYAVLHAAGRRGTDLLDVSRTWGSYLLGYAVVEVEAARSRRPAAEWRPPPAADLPLISALDPHQATRTFDEQFEVGLDLLLTGLDRSPGRS